MANKSKDRVGKEKKAPKAVSGTKDEKKPEVAAAPDSKTAKKHLGSSVVLPCTCAHAYQDEVYGKGQRVFNIGSQNRACTVCGAKR